MTEVTVTDLMLVLDALESRVDPLEAQVAEARGLLKVVAAHGLDHDVWLAINDFLERYGD